MREEFIFIKLNPPPELSPNNSYPRYYHKTDKLGRPIYFEIMGRLDVKQLFAVTNTDRLLKNHGERRIPPHPIFSPFSILSPHPFCIVYEYEKLVKYRLAACSEKAGTHIEQSCTILDLKNVSLSSFSSVYNVVQQVSKIAQEYYVRLRNMECLVFGGGLT